MNSFNFILLIFPFQRINSFLIISMIVKKVDDCIRKIDLDEKINLYVRNNITCDHFRGENLDYNKPIFAPIPYGLGQKIRIEVGDNGINNMNGDCYFDMDIFINNRIINKYNIELWECNDCSNGQYFYPDNQMLNCYKPGTIFNGPKNYSLYFQINSIKQLDFPISEYFYFLNSSNYYFISPNDFNNTINLIDLYSENILYAKNSEGNIIASFYDYIYYKISFEKYSNHKGKFLRKNLF